LTLIALVDTNLLSCFAILIFSLNFKGPCVHSVVPQELTGVSKCHLLSFCTFLYLDIIYIETAYAVIALLVYTFSIYPHYPLAGHPARYLLKYLQPGWLKSADTDG